MQVIENGPNQVAHEDNLMKQLMKAAKALSTLMMARPILLLGMDIRSEGGGGGQ